ncbi:hypothetical protein B0H13DRAFT_1922812 [Mycena leptocephala]|nr:hypothetical protein B0H13DRAFT_1922812 [Mycena leptocephala]
MAFVAARCSNETIIYPLVCARTCKKETWEDMVSLFNLIIEVWGEKAKEEVYDIWNFATDGDHLRRQAGHEVFVQVIALFCDMFSRSRWIMAVSLALCLRRCLLLLPGQDEVSVESLLNPDDPQDVPRAIDLLEAIVALLTPHFTRHQSAVRGRLVTSLAHMSNCDLDASWRKGRLETMDIFPKVSHLNHAVYDVHAVLKSNPEIDFCDSTVTGYILESLKA